MDAVQISHTLLQAIFIDKEKFTPQVVKEIIKWNQELEPSVNMTQSILSAFLLPNQHRVDEDGEIIEVKLETMTQYMFYLILRPLTEQQNLHRLEKAVEDIPKTLRQLQQHKCPKNFLRAFLLFLKKNKVKVEHLINKQYVLEQWIHIAPEILQMYCDAFSILIEKYSIHENNQQQANLKVALLINAEDFDKRIYELIDKKQYSICMTLIKLSNCQKHHVNKMLQKMTNNKQASKAADYVKSLKLNPADYPALGERLYKNTARHFLTKNGWQYAEQIFQTHPQALACIIEDLIFKKKLSQALSIWYRNQACRAHIHKQEALTFLKPHIESNGKDILIDKLKQNYLHKDEFGPTNRQKYLCMEELGFREDQVVWIDENTNNISQCMEQILSSQILGIDTESIVGQTKFDKSQHSKFEQAALIQISTRNKVYLIDGFTVKHIPQVKHTITKYIQNEGLIVGHTLDNDMDCLLKSVGCSDEQIKELKSIKVVDVWKLFKSVYPKQRFSSLAFITQQMLGKELCKDQTLTNWQRRPLRRNQIHYAAMDAVVVIKIYEKFIEQVGQQMIEYYCSIDANEF